MRTDSVSLSAQAISSARDFILEKFGKDFLPKNAIVYKSKDKNAQEMRSIHHSRRDTSS
jgi:DNA topoisomerase-1